MKSHGEVNIRSFAQIISSFDKSYNTSIKSIRDPEHHAMKTGPWGSSKTSENLS
jgi:hypothetical protein